MDKNEWVNQFQDGLRRAGQDSSLKNHVQTREAAFGAKLSASVSPCVWLYNSPFQITVDMAGGGGRTYVTDERVQFSQATAADVGRLLDSVGITKCKTRGCTNPAFDPATTSSHRNGRCEQCAMHVLDRELENAQLAEKRKLAQLDRKYRARGFTHRVEAWVHGEGGDRQLSIWMCNPTDATIRSELLRTSGADLQTYTLHQL